MGLNVQSDFWYDKCVFITGHTGFKGGWLSLWLQNMGAKVHGYALRPPTKPNLFSVAEIGKNMSSSEISDIQDANKLRNVMQTVRPDIVFHLAAQPLVHYSYDHPTETYATNVMGTVNLLEAVRTTPGVKVVVNVTTDKCYENREWVWGYRENDPMGGFDPYSSSKGCAELVTTAYRRSYLESVGIALASARSGNVIGGGDWSENRLIPDFLRALDTGDALEVRSPLSTRPWQHVLEPLSGYLMLAEQLYLKGTRFAEAWNFGPTHKDMCSVQWIVEHLTKIRKDINWQYDGKLQPHEAHNLKLDSSKAHSQLGWESKWHLETALKKTVEWHQAWLDKQNMHAFTLKQIAEYESSHVTL